MAAKGERAEGVRILLIFIDGLGIGANDPAINPCLRGKFRIFNNIQKDELPYAGNVLGLDANLGVEGLPQSATGQTTLLTGVNAAKLLNRHLNGFPNKRLREVLTRESILKKLKEKGRKVAFINAFRPLFFQLDPYAILRRLSTTTIANLVADLPFFSLEDVKTERAIYQEFTNRDLIKKGFPVPVFTPQKAGQILARAAEEYDFCLYEYFQTDRAGHSQDMERAVEELSKLEEFLLSLLENTNLTSTLILLTSDHGNLEDLSVKTHTRNPAMTILWGQGKDQVAQRLKSLEDVAPALFQALMTT